MVEPATRRGARAHRAGDLVEEAVVARREREVLGRGGGVRHEPSVPGMRHEEVQEEESRALHHRVLLAQELPVAGEPVVLEQVGDEPRPAGRERAPARAVHRRRHPPQVGVLVGHPPARPVVLAGHRGALLAQLADQSEQGLRALRQVPDLGRPVVHLRVDVRRVLGVPHGVHAGVPQPLEVRGLAPRPRGGEEQVPAELKQEAGERGVVAAREPLEPLVRGEGGVGSRPEVDRHAPEEAPVLGDVVPADRVERAFQGSPQRGFHPCLGVTAHVLVGHEARGRGHEEGHGVRALHDQGVVVHADAAALRRGLEAGLVPQGPAHAQVVGGLAPHDEAVRAHAVHPEVVGGVVRVGLVAGAPELGPEGDPSRLVGDEAHHDHLVDRRREHLAREGHSALLVARGRDRGIEVELVPVAGHLARARETEPDGAERLVLLLLHRVAHQVAAERLVGADELAVEDQSPDLGERAVAPLDRRRVGAARPVGVLVDRDLLLVGLPEHHRAEAAVADGKGVVPLLRRVRVPEERGGVALSRGGDGRGGVLSPAGESRGGRARDRKRNDDHPADLRVPQGHGGTVRIVVEHGSQRDGSAFAKR